MPLLLPRPAVCSLPSTLSRAGPSISRATTSSFLSHPFSTTSSQQNRPAVPPESPKYITVPEPLQSSEARRPPIKGHLPVPRDIFTRRSGGGGGEVKTTPEYIMRTAPLSQAEKEGRPPRNELDAWRRKMAASRREALAAGLKGLYERKQTAEAALVLKSQKKATRNRLAAMAKERRDERLTRPSVPRAVVRDVAVRPDPNRFEVAEASRKRTEARMAAQSEARKDALQQLYIAAKDFIVTEDELQKKVDELFSEDYFQSKGAPDALSVWDLYGSPINISAMVDQSGYGGDTSIMNYELYQPTSSKTAKKQKLVAEELTGGKMP